MDSFNKKQQNQSNNVEQATQNKSNNSKAKQTGNAQKDGFRYDYDDSSDLK
ncbi:hypothetical protein [Bacillus solitudinis]|uniref:hypothetical protein n=1 Tax=Bacillus solitudinis TaxID=2014074 RepID=UPI0012FE66EC|nr:hypothetical protein [Bacillus solitudinis]